MFSAADERKLIVELAAIMTGRHLTTAWVIGLATFPSLPPRVIGSKESLNERLYV